MNILKNKKQLSAILGLTCMLLLAFFLGKKENIKSLVSDDSNPTGASRIKRIIVSPSTEEKAKALLANAPEKTKLAEDSMVYLRDLMTDPAFATFFNHTLDFFGDSPAAYPAARFVGLSLLFNGSQEHFYLRSWTQKEIQSHSEEIMKVLEAKSDEIDLNPYFHSSMLNLVHQLEVSPERKLSFYSKTIEKPLVLTDGGGLHDYSLAFETALILSKNTKVDSSTVAPVVSRAIAANGDDPKKMESLKVRVETYFPELRYLFVN